MRNEEKLSAFELAVLRRMMEDTTTPPKLPGATVGGVEVEERSLTGSGFLTELRSTPETIWFPSDVSLRWGARVVATVNGSEDVGVLVFVDGGRVTAVEGYTFGGVEWPATIDHFRFRLVDDEVDAAKQ